MRKLMFIVAPLLMTVSDDLRSDSSLFDSYLVQESSKYAIGVEYLYFDQSLDLFDFSDEFKGAKPIGAESIKWSLVASLTQDMRLNYEVSRNSAEVTRETLPKLTQSSASKHVLEADMNVLRLSNWQGKLSLGFRYVAQAKSSIDCYSRGSVVLGGSCEEADFRLFDAEVYEQSGELSFLPVFNFEARQRGVSLAFSINKSISLGSIRHSFEIVHSELSFLSSSPLFEITDPFILEATVNDQNIHTLVNQIRDELPQVKPWHETSLEYQLEISKNLSAHLHLVAKASATLISRSGYSERLGGQEIKNNFGLDLSLWGKMNQNLAVYIRGEAYTNYLAGVEPITYNRKTSQYFDYPYAQIAVGFAFFF